MKPARARLAAVVVAALATVGWGLETASADTAPYRVRFFLCIANGGAIGVPRDTPLYLQNGWASGTKGLVVAALPKITNTIELETPLGSTPRIVSPAFGPVTGQPNEGWSALFRVDLAALSAGESARIHWTFTLSQPTEDLVLPFTDDSPGGGLAYHQHMNAGSYDLGSCTVTAT